VGVAYTKLVSNAKTRASDMFHQSLVSFGYSLLIGQLGANENTMNVAYTKSVSNAKTRAGDMFH
jgi:hypothetical protein